MEDHFLFSIVIPAHNEEQNIEHTLNTLSRHLIQNHISHFEMIVVNDHSTDQTEKKLHELEAAIPQLRTLNNDFPMGFGYAIRKGLSSFRGEAVAIVMADLSDAPEDVVQYYKAIQAGHMAVFGSRFLKESEILNYPKLKLLLNRLGNGLVMLLFRIQHNDLTNAFKCYRREVIEAIQPLEAEFFDLCVEIPVKTVLKGFNYYTVPISWKEREKGYSKLKLSKMCWRYLSMVWKMWRNRGHSEKLARKSVILRSLRRRIRFF